MGAVEETHFADMRAIFETNVFGTISLVQAVLPFLREQGGGHILAVSSVAGLVAVRTAGIYEATKFAIEGFAEALAAEVSAFGIRTTLIEPGAYATDFLSGTSLKTASAASVRLPRRRSSSRCITTKKDGTNSTARQVEAIIPLKTVTPSDCRALARGE